MVSELQVLHTCQTEATMRAAAAQQTTRNALNFQTLKHAAKIMAMGNEVSDDTVVNASNFYIEIKI